MDATTVIQFGFDPFALFTGVVALVFAFSESRRNNSVIVKIIESRQTGGVSRSENAGSIFHEYKLIIRNVGIPLHSMSVSLSFNNFAGYGRISIPLKIQPTHGRQEEFSKGMVAQFGLKSYAMDSGEIKMLKDLRDAKKQSAVVSVYSQNYLAKSFRLGSWRDDVISA